MNHEIFHDNPIPINIVLASLGTSVGFSLVIYVWTQGRRMIAERLTVAPQQQFSETIQEEDAAECMSVLEL